MISKYVLLFLLIIFLSGCATTEYYTNPQSAGYTQQGLGGLCEACNREFLFSGYQLNNQVNITCPYCGRTQNLQMAANRWTYAVQQQNNAAWGQAVLGMASGVQQAQQQQAIVQQNAANQMAAYGQQMYQNSQQRANQLGTVTNPVNVKIKDY